MVNGCSMPYYVPEGVWYCEELDMSFEVIHNPEGSGMSIPNVLWKSQKDDLHGYFGYDKAISFCFYKYENGVCYEYSLFEGFMDYSNKQIILDIYYIDESYETSEECNIKYKEYTFIMISDIETIS